MLLPNWGFRNTVHAYHSKDSVKLPLKSITDNETSTGSLISLEKFIETRIPELKDGAKYNLLPYLFTGTLQTLYTFKADFHLNFPVFYAREIIEINEIDSNNKSVYKHLHKGEFTLDYVVKPNEDDLDPIKFKQKYNETLPEGYPKLHPRCRYYKENELNERVKNIWLNDDYPITIIIPGLAGGIQEAPIRSTCFNLFNKGHHVVVLNQRGCSRSIIKTAYLYTGLETDDLKFIINKLKKIYGSKRQIHVIGYSFGGLQLANYCAKEGKNSKITSAISISSPWDLNESMQHITKSLSGHYLFEPAVNYFLMKMVKSNMSVLSQNSEIFSMDIYNECKKRIKHPYEFDDQFTCKLVGLPSGKMYYYTASPIIRIFKIKTPFLVINSMDDPMISTDFPNLEIGRHPYMYMATSDLGGHYSFIKSNKDFWFSDVVSNWIDSWMEIDVVDPNDIDDNNWSLAGQDFQAI